MTPGPHQPRHRSGHRCGCSRSPGTAAPPPTPPRPTCCVPPARGRTCIRRSRSGTRSGSATPRSRSPDPVRRWSRSSVWPSSRPRSGCPPRPARPTSVRPSSCGTGSPRPGLGSGPGTCRRGGPGGSPGRRSRSRPAAAGFVDAQVAPFAHRIRPSGVDRLVEEAIVRFMPEEARRRREAAADGRHVHVHTLRCPSRAPCGCRPRSTSPTPWTSTPPCRPAPPGSPTSARSPRWTCAAPKPSARWPAGSSPSTSTPPTRTETPAPTPGREVVLHVHLSEDAITAPDFALHLARVANTRSLRRRRPGPHLVRPPRHQ